MAEPVATERNYAEWTWTTFLRVTTTIGYAKTYKIYKLHLSLANNFMQWYAGRSRGWWEVFYTYSQGNQRFPSQEEMYKKITEAKTYYNWKHRNEKI